MTFRDGVIVMGVKSHEPDFRIVRQNNVFCGPLSDKQNAQRRLSER